MQPINDPPSPAAQPNTPLELALYAVLILGTLLLAWIALWLYRFLPPLPYFFELLFPRPTDSARLMSAVLTIVGASEIIALQVVLASQARNFSGPPEALPRTRAFIHAAFAAAPWLYLVVLCLIARGAPSEL